MRMCSVRFGRVWLGPMEPRGLVANPYLPMTRSTCQGTVRAPLVKHGGTRCLCRECISMYIQSDNSPTDKIML